MIQTVILKASSVGPLQEKVNEALKDIMPAEVVDIKLSSAYDGDTDSYIAMIIYKLA
ncbi:hypothetical protein [Bacillus pseudomycoides]|uniref:hypothetical protein n=1 Tax=Bacillus pseudomycoides TaxID=64104 RepID=UPI00159BD3A6|nr:hypothetical protein [Bacillus pseudomycoides]